MDGPSLRARPAHFLAAAGERIAAAGHRGRRRSIGWRLVRGHRLPALCPDRAHARRGACAANAPVTAPSGGRVARIGVADGGRLIVAVQPHGGAGHVGAVLFWCLRPWHAGLLGDPCPPGAGVDDDDGVVGRRGTGRGLPRAHCRGCGHGAVPGGGHALRSRPQLFRRISAHKARSDVVFGLPGALCCVLAGQRGGQPPLAHFARVERLGHAAGLRTVASRRPPPVSAGGAPRTFVVHGAALAAGPGRGGHAGGHYQQLGVASGLKPYGRAGGAAFLSTTYPFAACSAIAKACAPAACAVYPETRP